MESFYCGGYDFLLQSGWPNGVIAWWRAIGIDGSAKLSVPVDHTDVSGFLLDPPSFEGILPTAGNLPATYPLSECAQLLEGIHMLSRWVVLPSSSALVHVGNHLRGRAYREPSKIMIWLVAVVLSLSFSQAWGEIGSGKKKAIVAAGFGYQIGAASTIAVKVYDAESGDILSNEIYELAVKESNGVQSNHGPRIFAGGVGLGATDLSNFVLRVYDANTGVFQWEGRLNLVQPDWKAGGKVVSTALPRRATITRVHIVEATIEQPVFLLRAMDAVTGLLVWEDEFTTIRTRIPRAQQITSRSIQPDGSSIAGSRTFNFRIRMYDLNGKNVLWEDQLSQPGSDERPEPFHSDQADILPAWPSLSQEESAAGSI